MSRLPSLLRTLLRPAASQAPATLDPVDVGRIGEAVAHRLLPEVAEFAGRLDRVEAALAGADSAASALAGEVEMVLDGLSREIFRLQAQVEQLRLALANAPVVDGAVPGPRPALAPHTRAG